MSEADRVTTVISDFGGVLTTPLIRSFAAVQDQTGVPFDLTALTICSASRYPTGACSWWLPSGSSRV